MGLKLPQSRPSAAPQLKRREVPVEAILQVMGNNPYAQAIDRVTPMLSKALEQRAQRRRDAATVGQMASAVGEAAPQGDVDPSTYGTLLTLKENRRQAKADAARKRVGMEYELEKMRKGYTEKDPVTGKEITYSGVQGLKLIDDPEGNPMIIRDDTYAPAEAPFRGGGRGGGGGVRRPDDFLRAEYLRESEPFKASLQGYNEGKAAAQQQTGVGDAALVRAIVKVAEGKGARISNDDALAFAQAGSIPQNLQAAWLKAISGQTLAPEVRVQFVRLLEDYYKPAVEGQARRDERYRYLSRGKGIPEDLVVGQGLIPPPPATQNPQGVVGGVQEVERATADGRIAIFDATTKKFLRYK